MSSLDDAETAALLDRIKAAMAERGVNMKKLAERTGVPYRTMQGYLLGKRAMPLGLLRSLAKELDISAHWLLCGLDGLIDETVLDQSVLDPFHDMLRFGVPRDKQPALLHYLYDTGYQHQFYSSPEAQRTRDGIDAELRRAADPDYDAKWRERIAGDLRHLAEHARGVEAELNDPGLDERRRAHLQDHLKSVRTSERLMRDWLERSLAGNGSV